MSRIWNELKRSKTRFENEGGGDYYYYLIGWCTISIVIGFLLLPPMTTTTRPDGFNSAATSMTATTTKDAQMGPPWLALFRNKPIKTKMIIPTTTTTTTIIYTEPLKVNSNGRDGDSLDRPATSAPTSKEILSPIRYPIPPQTPKTTDDGLTFHPNGHLLLHLPSTKPLTTHPILTLIQRAKIEWEAKLSRQSKSLKECVNEYIRRYGRKPPAGFERWYAFAKENKVKLVDEYDSISRDLFPFWALPPKELRSRAEKLKNEETRMFMLNFVNGTITRTGPGADLLRAQRLVELFQLFNHHLVEGKLAQNVSICMEIDDQAQVLLGWDQQKRLFELAKVGQFLPTEYKVQGDKNVRGWASSCPPNSSLRESLTKFKSTTRRNTDPLSKLDELMNTSNHSWIFDHPRSMDICSDPKRIDLHGATAVDPSAARPILPLFAFSKTNLHADILVTPLEQYASRYPSKEIPWNKRPYNKLYWRGSTTGSDFSDRNPKWNTSHRMRLYHHTHQNDSTWKVLLGGDVFPNGDKQANTIPVQEREFSREKLNREYMNITFVNQPIQCEPNVCEQMAKMINFVPHVQPEDVGEYKYAMDIDGNGWSGRFHRLLSTKHLVIKSTIFPEWYSDQIQPWYHYVPSRVDYSDLYDIMGFFLGGVNGSIGHDELAEVIARQGQEFANDHWRFEDMASYMFRLVLEWTRLIQRADDGTSADFDDSLI